ncbi:hypothetical protein KC333_g69 [Hortaea werneckii]|nr:hypothetical protein KC333_g69 [Hortaea werneckii]
MSPLLYLSSSRMCAQLSLLLPLLLRPLRETGKAMAVVDGEADAENPQTPNTTPPTRPPTAEKTTQQPPQPPWKSRLNTANPAPSGARRAPTTVGSATPAWKPKTTTASGSTTASDGGTTASSSLTTTHVAVYGAQNSLSFREALSGRTQERMAFAMLIYSLLALPYPASLFAYHVFLLARGETTREYLNSHKFLPRDRHRPFTLGGKWTRNWIAGLCRPRGLGEEGTQGTE